jgi:adenosylcobyric acid synthase
VGTKAVLDPADAKLVRAFIVNRMRGDPSLFEEGMRAITRHTGWLALGLVPYLEAVRGLPAEDAAELTDFARARRPGARLGIAVPLLPWIANFDDLDPLRIEPDVDLRMVRQGLPLPRDCDLVILPGSKATIADLAALRAEGWDIDIAAHVRSGGRVLGLCGGYQMLGRTIADPDGIEGSPQAVAGLGLLDVETVLTGRKQLNRVAGVLAACDVRLEGYEMHVGHTTGPATKRPMFILNDGRYDGAKRADGLVAGTYLHGVFRADASRRALLTAYGASEIGGYSYAAGVEEALDALAAHVEAHVDVGRLLSLAR